MDETEKNLYELAYLLSPNEAEKGNSAESVLEKVRSIIEQKSGTINQEQAPSPKKLAYQINGQKDALLGVLRFTIKGDSINELQKTLRLDSKLIRFSISLITPQQLLEEQRPPRIRTTGAPSPQPTYTPKPKEAPAEIKPEEFEKKLEEILKE